MRYPFFIMMLAGTLLISPGPIAAAAPSVGVVDSSFVMPDGARTLQQSLIVEAPAAVLWKAFSETAEYKRWSAPIAAIDMRVGGSLEASYDLSHPLGDRDTIIAAHAKQTFVILKQSPRSFVSKLDFCTSAGFSDGFGTRSRSGATGAGPQAVITDFGILKPMAGSEELQLTGHFENVTPRQAVESTGWPLTVADKMDVIAAPTNDELHVLREMHARTRGSR